MENSKIEWTGATFNVVAGCQEVHTGCKNCYARRQGARFGAKWGPHGTRVRFSDAYWKQPLAWNSQAARGYCPLCCASDPDCPRCKGSRGEPYQLRVFCGSLCDVFEDWEGPIVDTKGRELWTTGDGNYVDPGPRRGRLTRAHRLATFSDLRRDLFNLIDTTPNLQWILATKRPENIRRFWTAVDASHLGKGLVYCNRPMRDNVTLLYSASDQPTLEAGIDYLLACRDLVPTRGLSLEPLVGPIILKPEWLEALDWVIVGGESGKNARPCNVRDVRSLRRQCRDAGVAFFLKQLGANVLDNDTTSATHFVESQCWPDGTEVDYHRVLLKHKKGGDPSEWPQDLRKGTRQWPE